MKTMKKLILTIALLPLSALASVTAVSEGGFSVQHQIETVASPDQVYAAMQRINEWWNPEHSWSGNADNLYFEARVRGCFCERLPDNGGVEHLHIIYLAPGKEVHLDGALGPLQGMAANGRMIWKIDATESGSEVTFTYHVTGFMEGGFAGLAPVVDGVISEQLNRLGQLLSGPAE